MKAGSIPCRDKSLRAYRGEAIISTGEPPGSDEAPISPGEAAIRIMLASLFSKPGRGLSDRTDLTVGDIAVQLIAQPEVDPAIP
jgi:hypothetical protein